MEQIFFLILVAVIGLVRWIAQVAENKRNAEAAKHAVTTPAAPAANAPVQRAPAQTEEERIRKFMEALGVPTTQAPPPPIQPPIVARTPAPQVQPTAQPPERRRQTVQPLDPFPRPVFPRPVMTVEPPPTTSSAAPFAPPPVPVAPPPLPTRETSILVEQSSRTAASSASEFNVRDIDEAAIEAESVRSGLERAAAARSGSGRSVIERLATHEGLRDAMVLREIFGPPRSLEPLERSVR